MTDFLREVVRAGSRTVDVSAGGTILVDVDTALDARALRLEGSPAAAFYAHLPAIPGVGWDLHNATAKDATIRASASDPGAVVKAGVHAHVYVTAQGLIARTGADPGRVGYTSPPKTGWSWYNQGGATVDESGDPIVLIAPGGTHYNMHGRKRALGATKTVVAAFSGLSVLPIGSGFPSFGVGWTDGTKLVACNCVNVPSGHGWMLEVHKYDNATTLNGVVQAGFPPPFGVAAWVKLTDDGTDRKVWLSSDEGAHWLQLWSEPRTTFLTATDHVLLVGEGGGAAWGVHNTLLHWIDS